MSTLKDFLGGSSDRFLELTDQTGTVEIDFTKFKAIKVTQGNGNLTLNAAKPSDAYVKDGLLFLSDNPNFTLTTNFDDTTDLLATPGYTLEHIVDPQESVFDLPTESPTNSGIQFNDDGTKLFVLDNSNRAVREYALSTAYDLSTATYTDWAPLGGIMSNTGALSFSNDGSSFYVRRNSSVNLIYQWEMSTPWDVSTATYGGKNNNFSAQTNDAFQVRFNADGTKAYLLAGSTGNDLYQYSLSTPYDITTATYDSITVSTSSSPQAFTISPDGSKLFILYAQTLVENSLPTPFVLTGMSATAFSITIPSGIFTGLDFGNVGKSLYTVESSLINVRTGLTVNDVEQYGDFVSVNTGRTADYAI